MSSTKQSKSIKLRSKKVRKLLKESPPFFVRWGTTIIIIVFLILILIILNTRYPYSDAENMLQHFLHR